jgi:hypothetical protein
MTFYPDGSAPPARSAVGSAALLFIRVDMFG